MLQVKFTLHITDFSPTYSIKEVENTHEAFRLAQNFMYGRATWEFLDISIIELDNNFSTTTETKIATVYGRNKKQNINGDF